MVKLYFLMTINIFMHIYIGENAHWDIYAPPPCKIITQFFFFILDVYCYKLVTKNVFL